jgi:hypothetical protein
MFRFSPTILFFLFGLPTSLFGQSQIDLDKIKQVTQDSTHAYYYPKLTEEFLKYPADFPAEKAIHIYYGQIYSKGYKIFNLTPERAEFNKLLKEQDLDKAILIGEKLLSDNPVDIEILSKLSFCYFKGGQQEKAGKLKIMVGILHPVILSSGDGDRFESPYKVVSVTDEYAIMGIERIEGISRQSKSGPSSTVDIWLVKKNGDPEQKTLCFEVLRNMDAFRSLRK